MHRRVLQWPVGARHTEIMSSDSVMALATRSVPRSAPGDRAGALWERLTEQPFDTVTDVPVLTDEHLVGLVPVERLLGAQPDVLVADLMDRDPPTVSPGVDQEVAAWVMVSHGESSLAVVDADGVFQGIVPPRRIMQVLLLAHEEDLSRIAGVVHDADSVRSRTVESVPRRVRHRLPWLLVGLIGAMVAAGVVGAFEQSISEQILLVFFLPGVVYMADAVGTQTETVVVRGLSLGVPIGRVARREIWTGLIIGLIVAVLFVPLGTLLFGDPRVMAAVGLAMFVSCAIASAVAMVLPYVLNRLGRDPAYGSGPLATVVQDVLSIACYGLIVTLLL